MGWATIKNGELLALAEKDFEVFLTGNAHHFVNETGEDVVYLEIGDRTPGGGVIYSDDDDIHKLAPADISVIRVADLPLPPTSGQAVLPWGDG